MCFHYTCISRYFFYCASLSISHVVQFTNMWFLTCSFASLIREKIYITNEKLPFCGCALWRIYDRYLSHIRVRLQIRKFPIGTLICLVWVPSAVKYHPLSEVAEVVILKFVPFLISNYSTGTVTVVSYHVQAKEKLFCYFYSVTYAEFLRLILSGRPYKRLNWNPSPLQLITPSGKSSLGFRQDSPCDAHGMNWLS